MKNVIILVLSLSSVLLLGSSLWAFQGLSDQKSQVTVLSQEIVGLKSENSVLLSQVQEKEALANQIVQESTELKNTIKSYFELNNAGQKDLSELREIYMNAAKSKEPAQIKVAAQKFEAQFAHFKGVADEWKTLLTEKKTDLEGVGINTQKDISSIEHTIPAVRESLDEIKAKAL